MSKNRLIETRSIDYIPLAERHGKTWHLGPVWFTGNAQLATVASGTIGIAAGLDIAWSAAAILTGCAFGTFFMAFHSTQGPQLGLPQMIQSRAQFGSMGALLVWFAALIAYIGFDAFNQILAGQSLQAMAGLRPDVSIIVFTVLAILLACIGYNWIHIAQRVLAYLMIAALTLFTIAMPFTLPLAGAHIAAASFKTIPFLTQFFAAASFQLTWAIYVSDYSRYLPRDVGVRASFWWTFLGSMIGAVWMMLLGLVAAAAFPHLEIAAAVRAAGESVFHGFGNILLAASLGGLLTATTLNLYGASLTLLSAVDSFRPFRPTQAMRIATITLAAVTATTLALASSGKFVDRFGDLLAVLLYLFTPWTAINLVDFYVVRKGHYSIREIFNRDGMYGRWSARGLTAYIGGFIAMIPFFSTGLYTGPVAKALGGADIAMVVGLPVSAILYLIACRNLDVDAERVRVEIADLGLEKEGLLF